jgi:hypothetical protein
MRPIRCSNLRRFLSRFNWPEIRCPNPMLLMFGLFSVGLAIYALVGVFQREHEVDMLQSDYVQQMVERINEEQREKFGDKGREVTGEYLLGEKPLPKLIRIMPASGR